MKKTKDIRRKPRKYYSTIVPLTCIAAAIGRNQVMLIRSQPIPEYGIGRIKPEHEDMDLSHFDFSDNEKLPDKLEKAKRLLGIIKSKSNTSKAYKSVAILESLVNTAEAIAVKIPKAEMLRRFRQTGRYTAKRRKH